MVTPAGRADPGWSRSCGALGCAATVTPSLAVAHLLGCVARLQLPESVTDRGKRYRNPIVLQCLADLRWPDGGGCHPLQNLLDYESVGAARRSVGSRAAGLCRGAFATRSASASRLRYWGCPLRAAPSTIARRCRTCSILARR